MNCNLRHRRRRRCDDSMQPGHLVQGETKGQEVTVYPWLAGVLTTDTTEDTSRGSVGVCAGGT